MCCSKRRQQQLLPYQQLQSTFPVERRQRGCCGARRQRRLLSEVEAQAISDNHTEPRTESQYFSATQHHPRSPMAALIAVSIGIGAEKLGRIISEKRLEHKDKKAAEKREVMYGQGESSSGHAAARTKLSSRRQKKKKDEMRQEEEQNARRRSVSSERTLVPEQLPPRYEDVVRDDARRA